MRNIARCGLWLVAALAAAQVPEKHACVDSREFPGDRKENQMFSAL